ncbi:pentapeptide repeat-containing protein [Brachybacterium sp. UNK5269]|uniref:pentapeptide repeat-containing protein n=1 Tax=Brachybacterium sp. UNK5269 TaxID=3408576 RepID=UPI003BB0858E
MPRSRTTPQPVLSPLRLPALDPGDTAALAAHGVVEVMSFQGTDLSHLDLTGTTFTECELLGVTAHGTTLTSARLIETRIERLHAPVLEASRSTWREVELVGSRLGALDIDDAAVRTTRIVGCKFDWLNLRSATLEDVLFEDCTFDELDLTGVTATRVAFVNCRAGSLALAHARLRDVDLRGLEMGSIGNLESLAGATLDAHQVAALAPAFAEHLRIRVEG